MKNGWEELVKEALREQEEALTKMMACGHPVAALNHPLAGTSVMTMYCRSCEIQGQKEKANV